MLKIPLHKPIKTQAAPPSTACAKSCHHPHKHTYSSTCKLCHCPCGPAAAHLAGHYGVVGVVVALGAVLVGRALAALVVQHAVGVQRHGVGGQVVAQHDAQRVADLWLRSLGTGN